MSLLFDPNAYGPRFAELLAEERLPHLGPGAPNEAVKPSLSEGPSEAFFEHVELLDKTMADACLSGLWLYHDFLDVSHTMSQRIKTAAGAYWHGIMHRREPDFANAKYWFRRTGAHPIFEPLCREARELAAACNPSPGAAFLADQSAWEPFRFIDLAEACYTRQAADTDLVRRVCLIEWRMLFDFCYRSAIGR